jgi:hypothetical protein
MELLQTKSLLAKLMATENLIVEQKQVETAAFDVKNRVLVLPILDKNISGSLYDLLVGHEVGHALYTPIEGMMKAKELGLSLSLMNVLDDSRIERKIKYKYPGIRASFVRGYQELIERDFFGTARIDLNTLNFIDRVNLFCKGGPAQGIYFTDVERELLKEIESTSTYDDVIEVAKKVTEYMKQEREEKQKNKFADGENDQDEGVGYDEYVDIELEDFDNSGYEDSKDESDTEEKKSTNEEHTDSDDSEELKESLDGSESDESDDDTDVSEGGWEGEEYDRHEEQEAEEEIKSLTDEAYEKNQKKLFKSNGTNYYYGNIPSFDLSKFIITHKEFWNHYKKFNEERDSSACSIDREAYHRIRQESVKVVSYLAKEFEMRKNADQMKRTTVAKTGELNMSKIFSYTFSEDLFKKATVVTDGKSHGLVMFLDWSGSMSDHLRGTIKQLINLCLFCKKVNIPFDVYAFSSEYRTSAEDDFYTNGGVPIKEGDIAIGNITLLNMLSGKMSSSEFSFACSALIRMSHGYRPAPFDLGGTPLNEAIMLAMEVVPEFKKQHNLQIVNTVFLTDGEGHSNRYIWKSVADFGDTKMIKDSGSYGTTFVICDPKTKHQQIVTSPHSNFLKLLKLRTGCNVVGFYILSPRDLKTTCWRNGANYTDSMRTDFRKNKYAILKRVGYDEYYLLNANEMGVEDENFAVKGKTTTRALVSAFSKHRGNRLGNRVVLNQFIGMIS